MKTILITGGTQFVSRFAAEYFVEKGYSVFVLNRNTRPQSAGVQLIQADRHEMGACLSGLRFEAVLDVTAYTAQDVHLLLDSLESYGTYVLISSSAVYPETALQPFREDTPISENHYWGKYGVDKIEAEQALIRREPEAYILRPPYLYGPMNNVYREAFVFECAEKDHPFYLPGDGEMRLQFFHVEDLCRMMEQILETKPSQHIYNVGNPETVSIREWVEMGYQVVGKTPRFVQVSREIEQRNYFSFYNYEYRLDVTRQQALVPECMPMEEGLAQAYQWYRENREKVTKKPLIEYIDRQLVSV